MSEAPPPEIAILVEAEGWHTVPELEAVIRRAAMAALATTDEPGDISLLLADDAAIRTLNADFRKLDKPTNVLSFPAPHMPGDPSPALGDIAFAYETCAREAADEEKPLAHHLSHLVVHGVLHLLGYDHEDDAEADEMEALETEVLASLGIADPYADHRDAAE
ncbi:MAG: rRNA maturation RNase YbeY [Rhizobiales bacterium PAR1]|nr:MAG: rRNA maturation RNase YbeY [Rhizobiales bacterium PAR1]